ncbi:hypothetical protein UJ101_01938 [Flavobacteriaceae bacterium UJ101]|nr:hypothetical protein UJ101_01938 [Flavobacteriaceae bacterium UJ101]
MKILNVFFALVTVGILASCSSTQKVTQKDMKTETFWINSAKVDCVGVGPMSCMQVQKGDYILFGNWQNFYDQIEGFDYEPGYIYKLKVEVEDLDPRMVPADASSKRYKLVEVLRKEADQKAQVNDIWVLAQIEGKDITISDEKERPRLEINLAQRKIMGKGVCNRMFGELKNLTAEKIEFGAIGTTRMMCINNMELEDQYTKTIGNTAQYAIEEGQLILKDDTGKEILRFKKVD